MTFDRNKRPPFSDNHRCLSFTQRTNGRYLVTLVLSEHQHCCFHCDVDFGCLPSISLNRGMWAFNDSGYSCTMTSSSHNHRDSLYKVNKYALQSVRNFPDPVNSSHSQTLKQNSESLFGSWAIIRVFMSLRKSSGRRTPCFSHRFSSNSADNFFRVWAA
jgi:hypothetical protein